MKTEGNGFMKNKLLILLVMIMMSISLCACGGEAGSAENKNEVTSNGQPIVTQKELAQYIRKVEITEENWKDYIDIIEEEIVTKNPFGEVVDTSVRREWGCKVGNCVCYSDDFAIELKWNSDKIYPWGEKGSSIFMQGSGSTFDDSGAQEGYYEKMNPERNVDYVQEDYLFARAKGYVLIMELPEELWSTNEDGEQGIYLSENNFRVKYEISSMLKDIYEEYK